MNHVLWAHTSPQRLHNLNLQMGSIAVLQPQDPVFDPELRLLSVQSSHFLSVSLWGFSGFLPLSKNLLVGRLSTLYFPMVGMSLGNLLCIMHWDGLVSYPGVVPLCTYCSLVWIQIHFDHDTPLTEDEWKYGWGFTAWSMFSCVPAFWDTVYVESCVSDMPHDFSGFSGFLTHAKYMQWTGIPLRGFICSLELQVR